MAQEKERVPELPVGAGLMRRIQIGLQALDVLKDDPGNTVYGPLLNASLDSGAYTEMVRELRASAEGRKLLDERPTLQGPDLDLAALASMPEGTLGREFARYFEVNRIEPFVTTFAIDSDEAYLSKRYRETHDLFHVVTGYATDVLGEMELQAFVLGNTGVPSAALVLVFATALRVKMHGTAELREYFERLTAAYRRGKQSRVLLSVEWERYWDRPVRELSAQLCAPALDTLPAVNVGRFQHAA